MRLNQAGSSKLDSVLKVMLIAFVSLLAFSSGVFFGKKMSDIDQTHQASARSHDAQRGVASTAAHEVEEDVLSEEQVAELQKAASAQKSGQAAAEVRPGAVREVTEVSEEAPGAHKAQDSHDSAAHHAAAPAAAKEAPRPVVAQSPAKPDLSAAHQAAKRMAAEPAAPVASAPKTKTPVVAAAAPSQVARVPSSLPRAVGAQDVSFTIQVAAYPTLEQAQEHADRLVKQGFPAFPVAAQVSGKTWHRVSVGSFTSAREAAAFRTEFMKQAKVSQALVQRIQR
jgi:hypothetical protein